MLDQHGVINVNKILKKKILSLSLKYIIDIIKGKCARRE